MAQRIHSSRRQGTARLHGQPLIVKTITTLVLAAGAGVIMIPFLYLLSTALKDRDQLRQSPPPLIPVAANTVEIDGQAEPLYQVTFDGATSFQLVL